MKLAWITARRLTTTMFLHITTDEVWHKVYTEQLDASLAGARIAIAHDYLTQLGGAEKTVLALSRVFPGAPIYSMLYEPSATFPEFAHLDVRTPALNKVKMARKHHRAGLPIYPLVAQSTFIDADIVISSSSGWSHGFRTSGRKLVYCHTPARWLYERDNYLGDHSGVLSRVGLRAASRYLRKWDRRAASSCDTYVANSTAIKNRIADAYGIDAEVIFPPVSMSPQDKVEPIEGVLSWLGVGADEGSLDGSYYLCVSRLLPYKNVEAVVRSFAVGDRKLVLVGRGPEAERLREMKSPNVLMLSDLTDGALGWLYKNCRAIVAASYEDYGLTPLEAGVWGRPALALRYGGFLDTIHEDVSGMYFDEPTAPHIRATLSRFEENSLDPDKVRNHVKQFSEAAFAAKLRSLAGDLMTVGV